MQNIVSILLKNCLCTCKCFNGLIEVVLFSQISSHSHTHTRIYMYIYIYIYIYTYIQQQSYDQTYKRINKIFTINTFCHAMYRNQLCYKKTPIYSYDRTVRSLKTLKIMTNNIKTILFYILITARHLQLLRVITVIYSP